MEAILSDISDKKLSIVPVSNGLRDEDSHSNGGPISPPLASPFASGAMTPSFAPNTFPDLLTPTEVTVPNLIAAHTHHAHAGKLSADDMELPEDLDLGLPISELLKIGTQRAHADAEHSEGAKELMRGTLGLEEYIRWNVILWRVYDALELALSEHNEHPVLAPTYDPRTLGRSAVLAQDISHLLTLLPPTAPNASAIPPHTLSALSSPLPPFPLPSFLLPVFTSPPAPLLAYLTHIKSLSSSSSGASGLLAHAYVRYLGDMSGGQFIAARIKRSYNLKGADGLRFFHFDQGGRSAEELESEGGGETRKRLGELKDWYRRGMNEGVGEDKELKAHLVKEANLAFALNTHLFSLIQPTASPTAAAPATHSAHVSAKAGAVSPVPVSKWRGGVLEKVAIIIFAVLVGQALKRVGPYLAVASSKPV